MLRLQLQKWGAEVVLVENGSQALERLDSERFDLILFDIEMPLVNGIEATRRLRMENRLTTPIIGITHTDYMGRAMAAGMNAVLRKPIESRALFKAIREALAG